LQTFRDKLAVITGAGTGMGRELAKQLAAEGCHVAMCDVSADTMAETLRACQALAPQGTRLSTHLCDVADEAQVIRFRDAVTAAHASGHIHLLFNNAGIGGGGSFLVEDRADWDRTFAVCWFGVYHCARAFMPLLVAADQACIVNTSSVNGFYASLGPGIPQTAYSSAKFAVKGFSEALITDLRIHAPHVKVALVMPGHIGTEIANNSRKLHGKPPAKQMDAKEVANMRANAANWGASLDALSDDQLREVIAQRLDDFRDKAPLSAEGAAKIILNGVREGRFRILVGDDAHWLDQRVRAEPDRVYEPNFFAGFAGKAQ
jgi:NAD(P)-dependent dehydrogenase (short-subunit alcohol dehydrogenase family)